MAKICPRCNVAFTSSPAKAYHYKECGLPNVYAYTANGGLAELQCHGCGDHVVRIRSIDRLHAAIVGQIVQVRRSLLPVEVVFLTKYIGLSIPVDKSSPFAKADPTHALLRLAAVAGLRAGEERMDSPDINTLFSTLELVAFRSDDIDAGFDAAEAIITYFDPAGGWRADHKPMAYALEMVSPPRIEGVP